MKAKLKPHKLLSMLLALVMVVGMLPTTVLAASPDASNVYVNGNISFYNPTRLYYKNGDSDASFTGTSTDFNAAYDPATGTLTLKDYNGKGITVGGVGRTDITVVLKGTNIINDGSLENAVGGDITVTSSDGGTLSITRTLSGGNAAIGIETGLSASYTTGNVTIKGNAKVTINMTHNGTSTYEKAYGIFAKENITISENASVDITCATPNNTTGGGNCNGLYAAKDVTIDTNGTIKIDVTNAGKDKDNGYSYGVYHMRTATLTKVGNMEVQWKKEDNNTNYPGGAFTKGATFSDTDHAINVDTTNCYASYRCGSPYTVTVVNGDLTGPGVKYEKNSGKFLAGDKVNIKPNEKKSSDGTLIPFKEWTFSDVMLDKSATTASNTFTVLGKDVTVTATYNPFDGAPVFTRTSDSSGTIAFKTAVKPDNSEFFEYVKDGETTYNGLYPQPTTTSSASPYEYSVSASTYYAGNIQYLNAGDYRMAVTLNGERYLSEKFTVNYTAAPAGNYSDSVRVYNANKKLIGLGDGECLTANDATGASSYTGGSSYVARYDKSTGTLYLKDYQGVAADGMIYAHGDLNIVVESDSSFSTSVSATNDLYGIEANGKLNISGSGKLTVTANGNGDVYGIYAKEGVTISAPLNVQVGKVDSSKNGPVYGIYTRSGAISLSGADKTITATGGTSAVYGVYNAANTSTAITNNGNIDIRGKLTVNLYNGGSNDGIRTDGGGTITLDGATVNIPSNFGTGICNFKGNVVIENGSNVTLSSDTSYGIGIYARYGGDLTIENSTVTVSAKRLTASVEKGGLTIKDSIVDLTLDKAFYRVVETANNAANTIDLSGSGSVTLTASGEQTSAMIGGKVTATSGTKLEKGTYYPGLETYDGEYDGSSKTVLQFVHEDPAPATYTVSFDANGGTGTMADVTGVSGEYTLPANGFTAPADKQFKCWSVDGVEKAAGDTITVNANTTVTAIWKDAPVTPAINSVTVSPATAEVVKGKTQQFTATVDKTGDIAETVTWSVNSTKSTISDTGLLTVGADETAKTLTVTATSTADTTKSGTATVTVKVPVFHITVTNGKVTDGAGNSLLAVPEGSEIIFTANEPETGKQFKEWTGLDGVEFVDGTSKTSSTAKIKMPARAVTATAVYEDAPNANPAKPTISVNETYTYTGSEQTATVSGYDSATMNITGNVGTNAGGYTVSVTSKTGKWADGTIDAVTADWSIQKANPTYEVPTGLEGTKGNALSTVTLPAGFTWADGTTEMNTTGNQTFPATFTPSDTDNYNVVNNISVTVNVKEAAPTTYKVTVTNGAGSGDYAEGETVTITANAAPADKVFDKWEVVSGSIILADANSATTTFTMPASAVSVKATYKDAPHTHTFDQEIIKDAALKTAADCTHDAVYYKSCSCGAISTDDADTFTAINSALGHAWPEEGSWSKDTDKHWYECSRCHLKKDEAAHDYGGDDICDICTYDNSVPHTHNLTLVDENPATCTTPGNKAYYTCDGCDKWFEDATGSVEITDKTSVILTANGHTPSDWKFDADNHWKECTVVGCGVIIEDSKAAHTASDWITDTEATATTDGTKHKECTCLLYTSRCV